MLPTTEVCYGYLGICMLFIKKECWPSPDLPQFIGRLELNLKACHQPKNPHLNQISEREFLMSDFVLSSPSKAFQGGGLFFVLTFQFCFFSLLLLIMTESNFRGVDVSLIGDICGHSFRHWDPSCASFRQAICLSPYSCWVFWFPERVWEHTIPHSFLVLLILSPPVPPSSENTRPSTLDCFCHIHCNVSDPEDDLFFVSFGSSEEQPVPSSWALIEFPGFHCLPIHLSHKWGKFSNPLLSAPCQVSGAGGYPPECSPSWCLQRDREILLFFVLHFLSQLHAGIQTQGDIFHLVSFRSQGRCGVILITFSVPFLLLSRGLRVDHPLLSIHPLLCPVFCRDFGGEAKFYTNCHFHILPVCKTSLKE